VTYTFLVTNTGSVTVNGLSVSETAFSGSGTAPVASCPVSVLAPGASTTCSASYTTTQADVDAGKVDNTAVARGTDPDGGSVSSNTDTAQVLIPTAGPSISLVKTASPTTVTAAGQTVTYSFVVTNTGTVTLTGVRVAETAFTGTGTAPVPSCPTTTLAPGASTTCTATYTVRQADLDAGDPICNTAVAHGTDPAGNDVPSSPDDATVNVNGSPALTLVKKVNGQDTYTASGAGVTVTYTFLVTNTGTVTVNSLSVAETSFTGSGTAPVASCPVSVLAPGASTTCSASYTTTQADVDAGKVDNTAVARGTDPDGQQVSSNTDTAQVLIPTAGPSISLVKTASPTTVTAVGQTVTYSFLVTNTGSLTLTGVRVVETAFNGRGTAPVPSCPTTTLAPGASVTCTATYTVTQADIDGASTISNTAVAHGNDPTGHDVPSSPDDETVTVRPPSGSLTIEKTANPATVTAVGQSVRYEYRVTNTGTVTLHDVTVTELSAGWTGHGPLPTVTCPATTLAVGAHMTCSAGYSTLQADLNAGKIENRARADGKNPDNTQVTPAEDDAVVTVQTNPALTVEKSASPTTVFAAGETVTYTFVVRNTGNVTLSGVRIVETAFTGHGTAPVATCPAGASALAPGASVTCTATYTVTQADLDAGTVENTAVAKGTPPGGPVLPSPGEVTSPPDSAEVEAQPETDLALDKTASPTRVDAAGAQVTYPFRVTNRGDTTLTAECVTEQN
jgi:uncharacterized repeat protein (TIGR01451 family)